MLYKKSVEMVHDVSGQYGVQEGVNFRPLGAALALCLGRTRSVVVQQSQKGLVGRLLEHRCLLDVSEQSITEQILTCGVAMPSCFRFYLYIM